MLTFPTNGNGTDEAPGGAPNERFGPTQRLEGALASFARLLVRDVEPSDLLHELCRLAVDVLEMTGAGALLEDVDGRLRYAVATDAQTSKVEELQLSLREGPCMLAHRTATPVIVSDLHAEERFPTFGPSALEAGITSVFTFPLLRNGAAFGIIDLYCDSPRILSPEQQSDAQLIADMAAAAVLNRREYEDSAAVADRLQHTLDARILMEQAKGRVAEQFGIEVRRAEELIYDHAKRVGGPVGEIVAGIASGEIRIGSGATE